MSMVNDGGIPAVMNVTPGNGNDGVWGGSWSSWIILFLIFGLFGFGGYGGLGGGGAMQGALTRGDLCMDMSFRDVKESVAANGAAMQAGFRNIDNAVCQLGYNDAQLANGIQMQVANNGYQTQLGLQTLGAQLADCCCKTQSGIESVKTQTIMNTSALQAQMAAYDASAQRDAMQNRFDAAQNTCATLQAIDKVGDRIIDYLAADKAQTLRDENQALRLAASQAAQNQYLVNQLRPCPIPAYTVANPFCSCAATVA